jgi:subtilisin family serine protease
MPVGPGEIPADGHVEIQSLHPADSKTFLVAGSIELESGDEIPELLDGARIFADPEVRTSLTCGTSRAVGDAADVQARLDTQTLRQHGLDGNGVAIAVVDTGFYLPHLEKALGFRPKTDQANSSTPDTVATPPFSHRRGHGTMCAYDALLAAPEATLLDCAALLGRITHSAGETIASMTLAYSKLLYGWKTRRSGPKFNYPALVINNSWGIYHPSLDAPAGSKARFIDNPAHPFRLLVWLLTSVAGADVVFSAGNCGIDCPAPACLRETTGTINGAATYPEVLTVGGCDVDYELVGYSSRGPAIPWKPPFSQPEKPDVVAYTHFYGSEAAGRKRPDTGTSASCPVAAGVIAAIRTKRSPSATSPTSLNQTLRNTARQFGGSGWNPNYGYGVIQPVAAARALGLIP